MFKDPEYKEVFCHDCGKKANDRIRSTALSAMLFQSKLITARNPMGD